jgi:tRNA threonylcarbamoyladenosine biosynthesis protein TsaE
MEILSVSTEQTKKLAIEIADKLKPNDVVLLHGELGAGKTTFTKYLVEALGIPARVQSPTFVLLRKYEGTHVKVNHLDLYRVTSVEDVKALDIAELISENGFITIIEWPEIARAFLPETCIEIKFDVLAGDSERKINVQNLY